jgi:hypothetical protein
VSKEAVRHADAETIPPQRHRYQPSQQHLGIRETQLSDRREEAHRDRTGSARRRRPPAHRRERSKAARPGPEQCGRSAIRSRLPHRPLPCRRPVSANDRRGGPDAGTPSRSLAAASASPHSDPIHAGTHVGIWHSSTADWAGQVGMVRSVDMVNRSRTRNALRSSKNPHWIQVTHSYML